MKKEVRIEDERTIKIETDNNYLPSNKTIVESFCVDGLECAHYSLSQNGKMNFSAELDLDLLSEENKNHLLFSLDVDHPLFFAFYHLLAGEKELIIHDDSNKENDLKYLSIRNEDELIVLDFVDKIKNEKINDKFRIEFDSTLEYLANKDTVINNDIKKRLNYFFDESEKLLLEDYHQINFEEYVLRKKILEKERLSS